LERNRSRGGSASNAEIEAIGIASCKANCKLQRFSVSENRGLRAVSPYGLAAYVISLVSVRWLPIRWLLRKKRRVFSTLKAQEAGGDSLTFQESPNEQQKGLHTH
jgi:hypothetical protein